MNDIRILDIFDLVEYICSRIEVYFQSRVNNGAEYKTDTNQSVDSFQSSSPVVYRFLVPPDLIGDSGYPITCPSVCVVVESVTPTSRVSQDVSLSIHTAIYNPSTTDAETVVKNQGKETWSFSDGNGYTTTDAQICLYRQSLRLANQILEAVQGIALSGVRIENLTMTPPSIILEDFPYSTSVIKMDVSISQLVGANNNTANPLWNKIQELL